MCFYRVIVSSGILLRVFYGMKERASNCLDAKPQTTPQPYVLYVMPTQGSVNERETNRTGNWEHVPLKKCTHDVLHHQQQ